MVEEITMYVYDYSMTIQWHILYSARVDWHLTENLFSILDYLFFCYTLPDRNMLSQNPSSSVACQMFPNVQYYWKLPSFEEHFIVNVAMA